MQFVPKKICAFSKADTVGIPNFTKKFKFQWQQTYQQTTKNINWIFKLKISDFESDYWIGDSFRKKLYHDI